MATQTQSKKSKPRAAKPAPARAVKSTKRARPSLPGRSGPVNEWMELRRSAIHGLGGFARQDIPKGTRIIEYLGEKITNAEADRRYDDESMRRHHTFLFILNDRTCVDAAFDGNEARFINHSCDPNVFIRCTPERAEFYARRRIRAGEELTCDYGESQHDGKLPCRCGAAKCRGFI